MDSMLSYLAAGVAIGSMLAFIPSPLLALMVSETLKYGKKEGIIISLVPIITDIPIITLSFLLFSRLSNLNLVFTIISFMGFLFLLYVGYKGLKSKGIQADPNVEKPQNLKKGLITNLLNPSPYIFWITVAMPILIPAWNKNITFPFFYIFGFLFSLIGIRIIMTLLVEKSKKLFSSKGYLMFEKIISVLLIGFGVKLFLNGIEWMNK